MELQTVCIDRGQSAELGAEPGAAERMHLVLAARSATASIDPGMSSFWLVLRGQAELVGREGRFRLHAGQWISLDRGSQPWLHAARGSLVIGLAMPAAVQRQLQHTLQCVLYPGRGRVARQGLRRYLRLWRRTGGFRRAGSHRPALDQPALANLVWQVCALQDGFAHLVDQCPGRSLRRKQQIFVRMQRARLHLEGNMDRAVRIAELAELSNLSVWYFTKTFHALYGEGPQAAAARLRLQHATELLSDTRLSVGEIGAACGFMNNCSFSRAFRSRYGTPPSAFRVRAETDAQETGYRRAV